MKIELKNLKISKALSQETLAFTANLYIDGKKVAVASNSGQGGGSYATFTDSAARLAFQAHCKSLGKPDEFVLDDLVEETENQKICKTKTMFRFDGQVYSLNTKFGPEVKAWLDAKYGHGKVEIINEKYANA